MYQFLFYLQAYILYEPTTKSILIFKFATGVLEKFRTETRGSFADFVNCLVKKPFEQDQFFVFKMAARLIVFAFSTPGWPGHISHYISISWPSDNTLPDQELGMLLGTCHPKVCSILTCGNGTGNICMEPIAWQIQEHVKPAPEHDPTPSQWQGQGHGRQYSITFLMAARFLALLWTLSYFIVPGNLESGHLEVFVFVFGFEWILHWTIEDRGEKTTQGTSRRTLKGQPQNAMFVARADLEKPEIDHGKNYIEEEEKDWKERRKLAEKVLEPRVLSPAVQQSSDRVWVADRQRLPPSVGRQIR